ncbi:MAG TPA: class I SAM-dependent methyltransferase [Pirellulales bacterium]|jgi:SAM-dependent methyltransferase|nr:class I SAM-dependent methyltransferase [Pirellulales bacterium]
MDCKIAAFFSDHVSHFTQQLQEFDRQIAPDALPHSDQILENLTNCINNSLAVCAAFEKELEAADPLVLKDVQRRYREAIWPWFGKSWCMQRALTKPRGYPGDAMLLTAIYDGVAKSLGLGGYFDRYFLNTTLGRAVPARMWEARRFLMEELGRRRGRVDVMDVACGSCREYLGGFEPSADRETTFTCIDNDPETLEFAKSQTQAALANSGITGRFIRYNALRMVSAESNIRRFGRSDVIYSVGLCDYIPDEYLIPLLAGWRESLNPGGVVYVAFKDTKLYDKTEYQWLADWYFFQRTTDDCRQLFVSAGYDMSGVTMTRDPIGVIINFICRDKVPAIVRIDTPEEKLIPQHVDQVAKQVNSVGS